MSVSLTTVGFIQATDSVTGSIAFKKLLSSLVTTGTVFSEAQNASVGNVLTAITLPVSPVQFLYLKNLHATQTITVTWTPTGGVSAIVQTLQPGSYLILGEAAVGGGITALSLQGSGAGTTYEMILGG